MANTEKNVSSSLKSGPKFSNRIDAEGEDNQSNLVSSFDLFNPVHLWLSRSQHRPRQRLTVVAKESFGLFAFCCHEASYEVISDGCQQDHQEDNLSLTDSKTERRNINGEVRDSALIQYDNILNHLCIFGKQF